MAASNYTHFKYLMYDSCEQTLADFLCEYFPDCIVDEENECMEYDGHIYYANRIEMDNYHFPGGCGRIIEIVQMEYDD